MCLILIKFIATIFCHGKIQNKNVRNALRYVLINVGQVVCAEILMASDHGCPIEMHQIKIDKCDGMYDEKCQGDTTMPFHRARYDPSTGQSPNNPREQVTCKSYKLQY